MRLLLAVFGLFVFAVDCVTRVQNSDPAFDLWFSGYVVNWRKIILNV